MENVTITLTGPGVQESQEFNIQVSVAAIVNIGAKEARRKVTAWLVSEVGNMLVAGPPQLVISQQTVWRVPAILTATSVGPVGEVGAVEVDADNGELLTSDQLVTEILHNVEHLTRPTPAPVS